MRSSVLGIDWASVWRETELPSVLDQDRSARGRAEAGDVNLAEVGMILALIAALVFAWVAWMLVGSILRQSEKRRFEK